MANIDGQLADLHLRDEIDWALEQTKLLVKEYKQLYRENNLRVFYCRGKRLRNQPTVAYMVKDVSGRREVLRVDLLTGVAQLVGFTSKPAREQSDRILQKPTSTPYISPFSSSDPVLVE